ncbi:MULTISPECIES: hypothetical protein [Aeromonas]|uniref:Uncharacterized protein n=1 Tax=Aeromonas molluscorum 848 TaxID=1268236 RepID=R1GQX0_9GAMM|nr:hypothetical protein [Aeromonas molluscorum]EOD54095.1 hypothetical protein G113_16175 [Aeromonas molluscorum 848]
MTMIDLYLKAGSKSAMTLALKTAGFSQDPDSGALYHPDAALDVIGTIYQPTGETMVIEGEVVPVMAPAPGYHVNVRTRLAALATALDAERTYPETPVRVWA